MGPPRLRGANSRAGRSWKSPSRMIGLLFSRRCSSSSRSISISYAAFRPGWRTPTISTYCFGSHRPPPLALQMADARQRGYAASSSEIPGPGGGRVATRGDVCARRRGRRKGMGEIAEPSSGVGGDRGELAAEDELSEAESLCSDCDRCLRLSDRECCVPCI